MGLKRVFTEHPAAVGETYGEHGARAFKFGSRMMLAGVACVVHALFPCLFVHTASRTLEELRLGLPVRKAQPAAPKRVD